MGYDVIVVGARVAGSVTGMLLARAGLRVLVIDQARFPSDTLSTHQLQPPGVARLAEWGLLDKLLATGVPPTRRVRFNTVGAALDGSYPADGFMLSPRRTVLDAMLVDAARDAGAEVREATTVEELTGEGSIVTGVRCRAKETGRLTTEAARLVIGADGRRSRIAQLVGAREYRARQAGTTGCYTYWSGLPIDAGEIYALDGAVVGAWPTHDGQVITFTEWPAAQFAEFRREPESSLLDMLDRAGTLGARARGATRAAPIRFATELPNVFRKPYGPGWALVGDAGLTMDPITGLGMGHALRDAELVAEAVRLGLDSGPSLPKLLARYARARDRETTPMYDFTVGLAQLRPVSSAEQRMFAAISADPIATTAFLGTISGMLPMQRFFSPANLIRLVGVRGFLQLARNRPG
ncbi:MAG TPA: NAD(P)/FAD-dependent oxidoreductase [Jatrophihabitans sp.]|jgi:2-polyprenyl-6-methoxyphenol hydroxylase-like FAD-dependent oxidoreductase|nr:NAD(P)/FAD-dependent oxidoreductase [Jatrophihabitans sp.]